MADEQTDEAQVAKKKTSPMAALLVLAVASAGGFFTGTSFLAPKVMAGGADQAAPAEAQEPEEDGGHGAPADDGHGAPAAGGHGAPADDGHGGGGVADEGHFVEMGNILVNPRDSRGLRFLMATVALELEDASTRSMVLQREVQARDVVISVLERHTLEELSIPGARDSVRERVRAAVQETFQLSWLSVYIPQFVIN